VASSRALDAVVGLLRSAAAARRPDADAGTHGLSDRVSNRGAHLVAELRAHVDAST
jgi:hypothetical protein